MLSSLDPIWGFGREGPDPGGSKGRAEVMGACRLTPHPALHRSEPLEKESLPVLGLGELLVVPGWGHSDEWDHGGGSAVTGAVRGQGEGGERVLPAGWGKRPRRWGWEP